ncbi:hypothetical protein GF337_11780 [candidate division KSB1 bacterium]|nr:hypothetical protein [candidate division KSB1 bacterium]
MQAFCKISILIILIGVIVHPTFLIAQDTVATEAPAVQTDSVAMDTTKSGTGGSGSGKAPGLTGQTVLDLLGTAQEIGYLLIFVFILGVLFVFQQWFVLNREKADAAKIPVEKIKQYDLDDIKNMFTKVEGQQATEDGDQKVPLLRRIFRRKKASAFQLLFKLYTIYDTQKTTAGFSDEISSFKQYMKDLFNPFLTRLAFLSDTAGGLGLLGTVWGMFLVFYKGSPDQNEILSGMGVALSTTIIGLVISILLNSLATVVSNLFDGHLDRIDKMANIFYGRLMREEMKKGPVPIQVIGSGGGEIAVPATQVGPPQVDDQDEEEQQVTTKRKKGKPIVMPGEPASIKILSGDNQSGVVGSELPEPIIVEVRDEDGNLLEGETVVFTAEEGDGTFPNGSGHQKILTNEEGQAVTKFKFDKKAGEKTIRISVERAKHISLTMLAIAKPTPPVKMIEVRGNYQYGEIERRLPTPLSVAVLDKYDNPIKDYSIDFHLRRGEGRFQDSNNAHFSTKTNAEGLAEVYFIMGSKRGAREIEIEADKVDPSKIKFEVFAV